MINNPNAKIECNAHLELIEQFNTPVVYFLAAGLDRQIHRYGDHQTSFHALYVNDFLSGAGKNVVDAQRFDELLDTFGIQELKSHRLGFLSAFFILSSRRGKGYGKYLLNARMQYLKDRGMDLAFTGVRLAAKANITLSEKMGFETIHTTSVWGNKCKIMVCDLTKLPCIEYYAPL